MTPPKKQQQQQQQQQNKNKKAKQKQTKQTCDFWQQVSYARTAFRVSKSTIFKKNDPLLVYCLILKICGYRCLQ